MLYLMPEDETRNPCHQLGQEDQSQKHGVLENREKATVTTE